MEILSESDAVRKIAELVKSVGGRALLVGGCVRDRLLGITPKDLDVEVFGVEPTKLQELLKPCFKLDLVGISFGVIKLHHFDVDVAIPRRETKLGLGHRAFEMEYDPSLTVSDASARRDFTINAIYEDPLTGEVIDPWGGRKDLEDKVLRHVSEHFREDPLRVLRGMQFVARFGLKAAPETIEVCRAMTPEGLASERLFEEWAKLLVKGVKISHGLEFLRATGWVRYYPELERLIGCEQEAAWHPEGDVWEHTKCCLDAFAERRVNSDEDIVVGFAVLCHDFGKPATTRYDTFKKRITSKGHDEAGVEPTLSFLRRLTNEERLLKEVPPLVRYHMRPFAMWRDKSGDNAVRRLAAAAGRIDRLLRVADADDRGRPPFPPQPEHLAWLAEQAERLRVADSVPKPLVMGRHLIESGMKPGARFGAILKAAYEAQLDGVFSTLDDGLAWVREYLSRPELYVIWDWNGTLLDDTEASLDALNAMLVRRGLKEITLEYYRDHFAFPVRPFYAELGFRLESENWDAIAKEYHDEYHARKANLATDAESALAMLKARGVRQSLLSALRQDMLREDVGAFHIERYFENIVGTDNLDGCSKLDRARELAAKLPRMRLVLIGDSIHDKEVADAIGAECILCATGGHSASRLESVARTVPTLTDAVKLVLCS